MAAKKTIQDKKEMEETVYEAIRSVKNLYYSIMFLTVLSIIGVNVALWRTWVLHKKVRDLEIDKEPRVHRFGGRV